MNDIARIQSASAHGVLMEDIARIQGMLETASVHGRYRLMFERGWTISETKCEFCEEWAPSNYLICQHHECIDGEHVSSKLSDENNIRRFCWRHAKAVEESIHQYNRFITPFNAFTENALRLFLPLLIDLPPPLIQLIRDYLLVR